MPQPPREIPYGRASAQSAGPAVRVAEGVPLRLSDGPYPFDEPPDLARVIGVEDRMRVIADHLKSLCGPWDKLARQFIDAYFAAVLAAADGSPALRARCASAGGLFLPKDWAFSALRPLPQAHLAEDARADLAFWTGAAFVAVVVEGSATLGKDDRARLDRVAASGAAIARVPGRALAHGGFALALLPAPFQDFWEGVSLPSSPFGPDALAEF